MKKLWTTGDLAREAHVTDATIRQAILAGRLKAEKLGHIHVISDEEAQRWLARQAKRKRKAE